MARNIHSNDPFDPFPEHLPELKYVISEGDHISNDLKENKNIY